MKSGDKEKIRINKYLALHGHASRREADVLIKAGLVKINGVVAHLGDKVFGADKISVIRRGLIQLDKKYFAYNKPRGIITHSPQVDQKEIKDIANFGKGFAPVGRLDLDSRGLIIVTNDGRLTGRLLDPESEHEKEYRVSVSKNITEGFLKKISLGVKLEDFIIKKCKVCKVSDKMFDIILTEGKKHQIRRMCAKYDYAVRDLVRTRIMNIKLGSMKAGEKREIIGTELDKLLKSLGL